MCLFSWEDGQSFWHDSGFPNDQMIKYFTLSYDGTFVFVTEQEEVCILLYDFGLDLEFYSYQETKAKNKFLMTIFIFCVCVCVLLAVAVVGSRKNRFCVSFATISGLE